MISIAACGFALTTGIAFTGARLSWRRYKNARAAVPYRAALLDLAGQVADRARPDDFSLKAIAAAMVQAAGGQLQQKSVLSPAGVQPSVDDMLEQLRALVGPAAELVFSGVCLIATIRLIEDDRLGKLLGTLLVDNPSRFSDMYMRWANNLGHVEAVDPVRVARSVVADGFPSAVRVARQAECDLVAA